MLTIHYWNLMLTIHYWNLMLTIHYLEISIHYSAVAPIPPQKHRVRVTLGYSQTKKFTIPPQMYDVLIHAISSFEKFPPSTALSSENGMVLWYGTNYVFFRFQFFILL